MKEKLRALVLIAIFCVAACHAVQSVPPEGEKPYDPRPVMDGVIKRVQTDKYRFIVLGDAKHATTLPAMLKYIDTLAPDFVLTTGDMVQGGAGKSGPGYWEKFSMESGAEMRKRPWWPAIGNHEIAGGPITKLSELTDEDLLKQNQLSGVENFKKFYNLERDYYSFGFRNAVFIALPFRFPQGESETWLEEELKKARGAGKMIFIFNHSPFYTVGAKLKKDIPNESTSVTRLFDRYKVLAVFSGHDHGYYRTIREGIAYMISAGGGARLYIGDRIKEALPEDVYYFIDPSSSKGTFDPRAKKYLLHNGATGAPDRITDRPDQFFILVDVDGTKVQCTCLTAKGETFDALILSK